MADSAFERQIALDIAKLKETERETKKAEIPKLEYNNKTFQSWIKNGFDNIPRDVIAPEARKRQFLARVNPKGKIERRILRMFRIKTRDYSNSDSDPAKKKIPKEFIYYEESWKGSNWMGETFVMNDNIEGVYKEQEKEPVIKRDESTGEPEIIEYKRRGEHTIYYIPFSKKAVDEIIDKSDSEISEIQFMVKSSGRRDYFSYDEFTNYSWDKVEKILLTDGGVQAARAFGIGNVNNPSKPDYYIPPQQQQPQLQMQALQLQVRQLNQQLMQLQRRQQEQLTNSNSANQNLKQSQDEDPDRKSKANAKPKARLTTKTKPSHNSNNLQ